MKKTVPVTLLSSRHDAVFFCPAEPVFGAPAWLVFAADPARIAGAVDRFEHGGIIDLAFVGLAAGRHRGDLHVADDGEELFEALEQIAADDLHVIKIELDAHIGRADLGDDIGGMLDAAQEIARPVARIDRLDQQRDVGLGRVGCGALEIFDENGLRRRPLFRRHGAGHAMNGTAADRRDVFERALKSYVPIALASRQRGKTEFRALRRVDAELREAMPLELGRHRRRRDIIRKLELDRGKARSGSSAETLDQRALGEQMAEIGGKARHGVSWLLGETYLLILPRDSGEGGPPDPPSLARRATAGLSPPTA